MSVIQLLRPQQWLKNFFIFLPLFFDRHLFDADYITQAILIFFSYCLAASGIYCFNDICDIEVDKRHPEKCKRPIASGKLRKSQGYVITLVCFALSFFILFLSEWPVNSVTMVLVGVILFYILMNIVYCVKLKQIAIVDVFIISIGFVLRIMVGGISTRIHLSHWIVMMTFLLALFLAFSKRRDDVVMYENYGIKMRNNVNRYNLALLNQLIAMVACLTMMCYIMYTVSPEVIKRFNSSYLYVTSLFVFAGIVRYLQLTIVDVKSGSPTKVLMKDRFVQFCLLCWIITFTILLYL